MYMVVKDLSFRYGSRAILKDVRMQLDKGELVGILGPNGAGKTTLLKSIASIIPPGWRNIWIGNTDIRSIAPNELAKIQGYVPQQAAVGYPLTVMETVMLGRKPYMKWGVGSRDIALVSDIMDKLHLTGMAERYIDELSGGERQKVLIARALAQEPEVMLLDEPTSALDIRHQLEVLELVRSLACERNVLVVVIMHDLELAARYSDRIVLLKDGEVYAAGTPEQVLTEQHVEAVYEVQVDIRPGPLGLKLTPLRPAGAKEEKQPDVLWSQA